MKNWEKWLEINHDYNYFISYLRFDIDRLINVQVSTNIRLCLMIKYTLVIDDVRNDSTNGLYLGIIDLKKSKLNIFLFYFSAFYTKLYSSGLTAWIRSGNRKRMKKILTSKLNWRLSGMNEWRIYVYTSFPFHFLGDSLLMK